MSAQTDIATDLTRILGAKSDLKTSIEGKGVTVPSATKIDGYAALVDQIQQGGGGATVDPDADVRFFDYDGTLLYTYSAADFANLSELPANPSHQGLTAQGWNWTLADAKAYVASYGILDIGQMYVTSDGKTRLYLNLSEGRLTIPINLYQSVANGITIDWGDGSPTETYGTAGAARPMFTHTYAAAGSYVVSLAVTAGTALIGPNYYPPIPAGNTDVLALPSSLYRVEMGTNMDLGIAAFKNASYPSVYGIETITMTSGTHTPTDAFCGCARLKYITVPSSVTVLDNNIFNLCYSLRHISVPKNANLSGAATFRECASLDRMCFPEATTTIGANCLYGCTYLRRIAVPNTVTTIGGFLVSNYCLLSLPLPSGITVIPNYFCSKPYALKSISLPATLLTIGVGVFSANIFHKIIIPDSVTTLDNSAFEQSRFLTYLKIGSGVTSIGTGAFSQAVSLGEIHITATTPPTLGGSAFSGLKSDCIIYVPSSSLSAYQSATNWSTYASQMVGE